MPTSQISISKINAAIRGDLAYAREQYKARRNNKRNISLDLTIAKAILRNEGHQYAYLSGNVLQVTCAIRVTSFKDDERLVSMLDKAIGLDLEFKVSHDFVTTWTAERSYRFKLPYGGTLIIEARLDEGNATSCRSIQTGVKTTETPIYELICD